MVSAHLDQRRRWSSRLSLAAATVTGAVMVWSISRNSDPGAGWLRWLISIGLPPIIVSLLAAAQYRWGRSNGAGAAAAVLYWVLSAMFLMGALALYLFGGILQTVAWYVSRPTRRVTEATPISDAALGRDARV